MPFNYLEYARELFSTGGARVKNGSVQLAQEPQRPKNKVWATLDSIEPYIEHRDRGSRQIDSELASALRAVARELANEKTGK